MPPSAVKFGDFELDSAAFELRRKGRPIRLERIPLELLLLLVSRKGELVTRDEIVDKLWGSDVFIDTNTAINVAVRKVRQALRDEPDSPRFLLTVPSKGYRFVGTLVEEVEPLAAVAPVEVPVLPAVVTLPAPASSEKSPAERPRSRYWIAGVAVGLLLLTSAIALRVYLKRTASPPGRRIMLAVLPFNNLSGNPNQEYIADGLTEETLTDLGQLSPAEMGVIARTSAMAYKHTDKTISQIGRELGVDYVLEGSVRTEAGKARVSAQLIRVSDQTHLWAKNYDRDLHDLLNIENELGRNIAQQVQVKLEPKWQGDLAKARSTDPEAYDLYLKGRYYWNQRTPPGIKQSIGYYQQAIAKDPDFAQAYAGLAAAYNFATIVGSFFSEQESFPKAKAAALKAISLDPGNAEAHAALGMEKALYEHDFVGAKESFLKAIEANPNAAYAHLFYSNCYLMPMGRKGEAIAENKKALELDPLSLPINNFMAMTYMYAGEYDQSYQQFQRTIQLDPTFPLAHNYLFFMLAVTGRFEEAIQENQKFMVLSGYSPEEAAAETADMLRRFKNGGAHGFWQRNLEVILKARQAPQGPRPPASMVATAYALVGDKDKAYEWLNRAIDEHDGQDVIDLKCDPVYEPLRGDPRYVALLHKLGLPE